MSLAQFVRVYALTIPIFFVVDLLWLGVVARGFYQEHLGHLLRPDVRWLPALVFYLLFIAGLLVFAVLPAVERQSLARAVLLGGFLGFVAYATYDLTNLATMRDFPIIVAVVDMVWGFVLSAIVSAASFKVAMWVIGP